MLCDRSTTLKACHGFQLVHKNLLAYISVAVRDHYGKGRPHPLYSRVGFSVPSSPSEELRSLDVGLNEPKTALMFACHLGLMCYLTRDAAPGT